MKKLLLASTTLAFAPHAYAASAYPDCPNPPSGYAHVWHVDQAKGDNPDAAHGGTGTADGTKEHPFNSLQGVLMGYPTKVPGYSYPILSTVLYDHYPRTGANGARVDNDWNPDAPNANRINPGDQIVLHGGVTVPGGLNYGDIVASAKNLDGFEQTLWVSIAAAPGENAPRLQTLAISGAGWVFDGPKIVSKRTEGAANVGSLVRITNAEDVVVQNAFVASAFTDPKWDQTSGPNGWVTNQRVGFGIFGDRTSKSAQCITVQKNVIRWVGGGIGVVQTYHTTIDSNEVNGFSGDAIDNYSNSDATYSNNFVHNAFDAGDGIHPDMMQLAKYGANVDAQKNIVIINNRLIGMDDASIPFIRTPQGIINTDVIYDWVEARGNVIVTSACHALDLGGTSHSAITNNTVVSDGASSSCYPWLTVGDKSHKATGNIVANNAVAGMTVRQACDDGANWYGNVQVQYIAGGATKRAPIIACRNGQNIQFGGPGVYDGVVSDVTSLDKVFKKYNPPSTGINPPGSMDLTPVAGGPLAGKGQMLSSGGTGASLAPLDVGALAH